MRNILSVFICVVLCCGCSTIHRLSSPGDPYDLTNSKWADASGVILTRLEKETKKAGRYKPSKEEVQKTNLALKSLQELSEDKHPPSLHLLAQLLIYLDQRNEKQKNAFGLGPSFVTFKNKYPNSGLKEIAITMLTDSAKSGYPPALQSLRSLGIDLSEIETNDDSEQQAGHGFFGSIWDGIATSGEYLADGSVYVGEALYDGAAYTAGSIKDGTIATYDALEEVAPSKESVKKVVVAVVTVAAITGAAILAAKYPPPSGYSSYPQPQQDFRGCCSYHKGINVDAFGQETCTYTGFILCNDGEASPSCTC